LQQSILDRIRQQPRVCAKLELSTAEVLELGSSVYTRNSIAADGPTCSESPVFAFEIETSGNDTL